MEKLILIYTKKERWGILSLAIINFILLLTPVAFNTESYSNSETPEATEFISSIDSLFKEEAPSATPFIKHDSLFAFNPNNASLDELTRLGFSPKVAKNIINYRSKGGHYYNAKSLKKIYGMDSLFLKKIAPFVHIPNKHEKSSKKRFAKAKKEKKKAILAPFDPNTATESQLLSLGFSKRVAKNLINYRSKGGHFYQPEALKKIYGISNSFYETILPYIHIENSKPPNRFAKADKKPKKKKEAKKKKSWPKEKIEVNTASSEDLQKLPGIGPYFAKNILRYRDKLGGFYNVAQIGESYRLPDSTFQAISPYLTVDKSKISQFNPQFATFKEILRHPYISFEQTKYIMKAQRGIHLRELEDFLTVKIFTPEELAKVGPYFKFD